MALKPGYVPGVCNIGPAEIRRRTQAGWLGAILTAVLWLLFLFLRVPPAWRIVLFFPAAAAAVGFLQAAMHFCAAYGILGVFNLGAEAGKTDTVEQAEYRRKDRQKALLIVLYSAAVGAAVAAAGYLLNPPI